jgi:hypothetical protein
MPADVTVRFSATEAFEYRVDQPTGDDARTQAREWLDDRYVEFGCESVRPSGKVLLMDQVLAVARAAGSRKFHDDSAWAGAYARAVACALERTSVTVDVEGDSVN